MPSRSERRVLPLSAEDIDFVLELSQERIHRDRLERKEIESYLQEDFLSGLVLFEGERRIGYVLFRMSEFDGEVDEIAVRKDEEGKGGGALLLQKALEALDDGRRKTCFLEAREGNERARSLYSRMGFDGFRRRVAYYGDEDSICYRKELGKK